MSARNLESDKPPKDVRFWMVMMAIFISFFMVALEGNVVATALPTIASALHITEFVWIGSSYLLASTVLLPLSGGFAEAFGRRPVMLGSLLLFAAGGAIGGASQSMSVLTLGRVIQGVGAGGIYALTSIIIGDLVTLQERGMLTGFIALAWTGAGGLGPIIGGALAQQGQWRWLFYMNVPISGLCFIIVAIFMRLPVPPGTVAEKLGRIDWIGNIMIAISSTLIAVALTWGGVQYSWASAAVLVPLCVGVAMMGLCLVYEFTWCKNPFIPFHIVSNRTSLSGYLQMAILPIPWASLLYYLPVYYQACKLASPIASGVDIFGVVFTVAPLAIISGALVTKTGRYRGLLWTGWCIAVIGLGFLSTIEANSSRGKSIGFQAITGFGIGLVYTATNFPILAPLPVESNAYAISLYVFLRSFAQIWGVTIGSTVLQNELKRRLPSAFTSQFPAGAQLAYAAIPVIPTLPQPLLDEVRIAFAGSLAVLWRVSIAIAGAGFLSSLFMRGLPLHTDINKKWTMQSEEITEPEMKLVGTGVDS